MPTERTAFPNRVHARAVVSPKDAYSAHLISRILVEEESDRTPDSKGYNSHFELYLTAMRAIGADTQPIQYFLQRLSRGEMLITAAEAISLPEAIQQFVCTTFGFFAWDTHILAAAFVYGREAITASMFMPIVQQLEKSIHPEQKSAIQPLLYYLNRHIELDDSEHLPQALQMLVNLAGNDAKKWKDITLYAKMSLQARCRFLDEIQSKIQMNAAVTV